MDRWDLFVWVIAPIGLLVALVVTGYAYRRRNWPATVIGAAAAATAAWVAVTAPGASSEAFEDLGAAAVFAVLVIPLTVTAAVLAFAQGRRAARIVRRG